jgi:hypothetical protein
VSCGLSTRRLHLTLSSLFTLPRLNIVYVVFTFPESGNFLLYLLRNNAGTEAFIVQNYFPSANNTVIQQIASAYPDNVIDGSPFDTGFLNAVTPEFKRLAAFQGDVAFHAPRRFFLEQRANKQPIFSFRKLH